MVALPTIDDLARQAIEDTRLRPLKLIRSGPLTTNLYMTRGLARLVELTHEIGRDIHWVISDLGVHIPPGSCGPITPHDIEAFPRLPSYVECWKKWGKQYRREQIWTLRRMGARGAQICIHGGVDADGDHSETLFPVQDYQSAVFPWGGDSFTFHVGPWWVEQDNKWDMRGWIACLPSER
jgi:hypothetical protein